MRYKNARVTPLRLNFTKKPIKIFLCNLIYFSCRLSSQGCVDIQTEILALYSQPYLTPSNLTEIN